MFTEVPMFVHKISEQAPLAPQPTEKYCPGHIQTAESVVYFHEPIYKMFRKPENCRV